MVNETTNVSLFLFQNAFLYFSKYRHSLDVTDRFGWRCLHSASYIGYLPIVQYLIEKGANIEAPMLLFCSNFFTKCFSFKLLCSMVSTDGMT